MEVDVTRAVTLGSNRQQFTSNADGVVYANVQAGYPMQVSTLLSRLISAQRRAA